MSKEFLDSVMEAIVDSQRWENLKHLDEQSWKYTLVSHDIKNLIIKKVIFQNPATIIMWEDDTKTVVRCTKGDQFNPEAGIALCYMKKILGNDGSYHKVFKDWISKATRDAKIKARKKKVRAKKKIAKKRDAKCEK